MKIWETPGKFLMALTVGCALCGLATGASGQTSAPAATQAAPAPALTAPLNVKDANPPAAEDLSKGDPGGTLTGTVNDVPVSDAKKGLTLGDAVNQIGQNKVAINFVWTLVTGFLVMFMQAGFALVETGLCRAKNANHTMMMNFMVYGFGLFAYWVCGFAFQMGGVGATRKSRRNRHPQRRVRPPLVRQADWGLFGTHGFFLTQAGTYDVGVMVLFLFQMVFMDTAATIVTGAAAERWKFAAFAMSSVFLAALTYPLYANWAWGGGWLSQPRRQLRLGPWLLRFRRIGGGTRGGRHYRSSRLNDNRSAHWQIQPQRLLNAMPGHDIVIVLTGCFILAFGWFGFNPGSTLGASGNGALRIGSIAVNTMLAGCTGSFGAHLLHVDALREARRFDVW